MLASAAASCLLGGSMSSDLLRSTARVLLPRSVRNVLRSPKRALRLWLDQHRQIAHEPRPGWTLRCPQVAVDMAFNLQRDDPPQVEEFDDFLRLIRPLRDPLLFDIGCHFGLFSFAVAHYCGAGTRAVAVDPSGVACRMVEKIRDLNNWQQQIEVVQAAAGSEVGQLEMVDCGPAASGYFNLPGDQPAVDRTVVPMLTIDELRRRAKRVPTVVKIDVESFEAEVLAGGRETLAQNDVVVCIEVHHQIMRGRKADPLQPIRQLREYGYRRFERGGREVTPETLLEEEISRFIARK